MKKYELAKISTVALLLSFILSFVSSTLGQNNDLLNYPDYLTFQDQELTLNGKQGNEERYLLEYIDPERNWDNWSNLIAFRNYKGYKTKFVLDYHIAAIRKNNPDIKYAVYKHPEKQNVYILDFLTGTYEGDNPSYEFNLWFIFPASESETISIQYALRSYENPDLDRKVFNSSEEFGSYWTENRSDFISELEAISKKVKDSFINK